MYGIKIDVTPYKIYTLENPIDGKVFYIGRTIMKLKNRLINHLSPTEAKSHGEAHRAYMSSLKRRGVRPIIAEIDRTDYDNRKVIEEYWIQQFSAWGFMLTNRRHNMNKSYVARSERVKRFTSLTNQENELIKRLFNNGDFTAIANQMNVNPETIRQVMRKKSIARHYKEGIISYYKEKAKFIHDWYEQSFLKTA